MPTARASSFLGVFRRLTTCDGFNFGPIWVELLQVGPLGPILGDILVRFSLSRAFVNYRILELLHFYDVWNPHSSRLLLHFHILPFCERGR